MLIVIVALLAAILACLRFAAPALAAAVVPVSNDETGARTLAGAMVKDPDTIRGASFATVPPSGTPHGVSPALSFFPTAGEKFGIMTTGNSVYADAENTQSDSGEDLGGAGGEGRGNSAYDTSVLKLDLAVPENANCLKFDFAFYSEEYPEYVNTEYNDTFIAELDTTTWTTDNAEIIAPDNFAFDAQGSVVSINSTGNTGMNDINAGGTTYDGATVLLEAAHKVTSGDHSLYLSILDQADHVYDSAAFVDNIRFIRVANPDTDCIPGAQPVEDVKRNPLILVPGIPGTELNNSATGEEMWPNASVLANPLTPNDEFLLDLKLDGSGKEAQPDEIVREVLVKDVYDGTIRTLEDYGYTLNRDLFIFPYDWRKDLRSAPGGNFPDGTDRSLVEFVDHVREKSKLSDGTLPQVDIVAHSQGGLVTLAALQDQQSSGKVRKVLTLGTPVLGATKALGILQYQMPCFVDAVVFCLSHPPTVQEIFDTFPGAHQLLPSPAFDDAVGAPLRFDSTLREDGRYGEQGYDEWSTILKEDPDRNDTLIDDARLFHQEYDQLSLADSSVQFARVVGGKVDTPEVLRQYSHPDCKGPPGEPFDCETVLDYEIVKGNGDETVNLHSADLYDPQAGFDMRGQNDLGTIPNIYANGVNHGALPLDERVLGFANAYFGNRASTPQTFAGAQTFSASPTAREENDPRAQSTLNAMGTQDSLAAETESLASEFGLSDAPEPFGGRELEVVGPADGFMQDAQGNVLGHEPGQPEGTISREVLGGTYQAVGDTQTFFLNEGGSYSGDLKITGDRSVRLRVRDYAANEISGQAVFDVDAPAGAEVGVDFTNSQPLGDLRLEVDQNNDGTIDERRAPDSVVSGPSSSETEPPNTTAAVKALGGGQHEITLSAEDGPEGSGVASTRYFVEGGQSEQLYSGPFTVAGGSTVYFYSVDKAGNAESLRKVTVVSDLAITWGKQFGTSGADYVNGMALGPNGDAHVAGYVRNSVSGSTGTINDDATLGKYLSSDGTTAWNKRFGASTGDTAYDVAADQQGNTYVVGRGDVVNRGTSGGFVVKYDAQGNTNLASTSGNVWAKQFIDGTVRTVAVDPDNNVYISLNINSDVYVYKFAPDGALLASQPFGAYGCFGTGLLDFAFGSAVGTRSDDPSVYVTGITAGQKLDDPNNCNISTSEDSMFLIKFDGAMNKRWDRQFGGTGGDSTPIDLAVDPENNAYVTGYTSSGGKVRNPSPNGGLQNSLGGRDAFLFKFSSSGVGQYAKQFGTSGDDLARTIAIGPSQVVHVAGRTTGTFDQAKPNAGGGDVFLTKRRTEDGSELISRQFGSAGEDGALGVAYDWSSGKVVVAGTTDGSLFGTPNAGGVDGFVAKVDYNEPSGNPDTEAPPAPTIDLIASSDTGSSSTDNLTNDSTPTLSGSAEPTSIVKVKDGTTVLGTTTTSTAGAWSFTPTAPLAEGAHQLAATATDAAGNQSAASVTLTVTIDTTAPAATPPSHALTTPTQLSASAVPVLVSWPAATDAGGIDRYELRQSADGGATFTNMALSSQDQTNRSYTAMLAPGTSTYLYEARAVDKAGNGSWTRGSSFNVSDFPETNTSIAYAGTGWQSGSATNFFGGSVKFASASSKKATLTFTNAKQVGWVTTEGPSRGKAKVSLYQGTTLVASAVTVDTYASAVQYRRLLYSKGGLDSTKTYKLVVEVLGTKNASSTGTRVDVDSFVVIR